MAWFKTDDQLHDVGKTRKALRGAPGVRRDPAAMGLWILAGSWCADQVATDTANPDPGGWVPADELDRWADDPEPLAARLVAAGLWHPETVDALEGYRFHDWEDYQPTRQKVAADREAARERMATARSVRANKRGSSDNPVPVPEPKKDSPAPAGAETFEAWWSEYPRKTGKGAAQKAYLRALKKATAEELLEGLRAAARGWAADRTEAKFIPHPTTWLNQGRWADEAPAPLEQAAPAAPRVTLNQCDGTECPGAPHRWTDGRNHFACQGA